MTGPIRPLPVPSPGGPFPGPTAATTIPKPHIPPPPPPPRPTVPPGASIARAVAAGVVLAVAFAALLACGPGRPNHGGPPRITTSRSAR